MNNCRQIQSRFAGYLDGDLRAEEKHHIDKHVETCTECATAFGETQSFLGEVEEFLVHTGPTYSFETLRLRMAQIEPLEEIVAFLPKLKVQHTIPRFAVAMLVLVLVGGGGPFSLRNTKELYTAMKSPFKVQKTAIQDTYREYFDEDIA
jgi:hypothetical protein